MEQRNYMEFRDVESYILDIPKFTKKNQLQVTDSFYDFLGRPGENCKIIHVAGTNGKGSVCAYAEGILMECGYQVGLFTSPHLLCIRERMRINHKDISEKEFVFVFQRCMDQLEHFRKETDASYHPTFFELLFFMAMLWFEEKQPDYIVLETGLGGRLDTTNIVKRKAMCVLTKIAMDHMEYLGNTLEQIAEEKAGIIRKNVPVVYYAQEKNICAVVEKQIEKRQAYGISFQMEQCQNVKNHEKFIDFSFPFSYYGDSMIRVETYALYQIANVSLALLALQELLQEELTPAIARKAVAKVVWPCRMEEIAPDVIVDGAHNPDGMEAFLESIRKRTEDATTEEKHKNLLLFAVVKEKDRETMLQQIIKSALFDEIVITVAGGQRATSAEEIVKQFELFEYKGVVNAIEDAEQAYSYCLERKQMCRNTRLYIAGSLYLAGFIKNLQNGVYSD
ncbi:MAG: bifunctional folylpolyglutamate synthase/dihydrofolate synthase [Lachnospiraceae bacterium]